jgi:geranylgeranyl diphosphate synthase type II
MDSPSEGFNLFWGSACIFAPSPGQKPTRQLLPNQLNEQSAATCWLKRPRFWVGPALVSPVEGISSASSAPPTETADSELFPRAHSNEARSGEDALLSYLSGCRELVLAEISDIIPADGRHSGRLYELMVDYPFRDAKALRPSLCISACRALGGNLESVLRSAAVLELYHNAFLIHDDVEDGSMKRRSGQTLHRLHGIPAAVNVGDGILALSMAPLLDNVELLGLGKALRILQVVARMARESAEGQMMELEWIRDAQWDLQDRDYVRMVYKKSAFYSFITPVTVGSIAAGAERETIATLGRFAAMLGVAFQIRDDTLNLAGRESRYGKEIQGDLWEGKRTLVLLHALRTGTRAERSKAKRILGKPRPIQEPDSSLLGSDVKTLIERLADDGEMSRSAARQLIEALRQAPNGDSASYKTRDDVEYLRSLIDRCRSIEHAESAASRWADRSLRALDSLSLKIPDSEHRRFLYQLVDFVVDRDQ